MSPGPLVDLACVPRWLAGLVASTEGLRAEAFTRFVPPASSESRKAAVLMLFGEQEEAGPDVLLLRRADTLTAHPGQVAFPGGSADADDDGPVATALREAEEEVGVLAGGVLPVALLPELYVPGSGYLVTPVLAYWTEPMAVRPVDPAETSAVARVPVSRLTDPTHRFRVRHPSGYVGPAFSVPGMLVWGFTAGLLSGLLSLAGWERPWDRGDVRDLDSALWAANMEVSR
ncbi:MAG: CoA pyrophosphatase [Kutzneria sp.]|nr:CoA pyrophosphatase [Kutzneria sp.]MBV9845719.1 CoA pyrophosphatase [Kutzneria sp.]